MQNHHYRKCPRCEKDTVIPVKEGLLCLNCLWKRSEKQLNLPKHPSELL